MSIPMDVIREVQKQIREQSGLGGYDPEVQSLPSLPDVEDLIAELDPSPAYLRCKRCRGKFLSGVESLFCVYCGAEQHDPELPPEPVKFKSTVAYWWLLDALKLDELEIVGKGTGENEPNRGQASPKKEVTLSQLLDLEIRWPERTKKEVEIGSGHQFSQNKSPVNLAGVELENFFPSSNSGDAGAVEGPGSAAENESIGRNDAHGHGDVDLFENVDSMEADNLDESGNDFSGWATEFQGASSVNPQNVEHSFDSVGVSSGILSAQIDSVFGSEKDIKVEKSVTGPPDPSPSNNDWNDDDMWNNFSSGISMQAEPPESLKLETQDSSKKLDTSTVKNDDWDFGDQWQAGSGKVSDSFKVDEVDDSYDEWNDFSTSSSIPQHQFNPPSEPFQSEPHASEIDLFSSNDLQDESFGEFSQPALFSSSLHNSSMELNQLKSESNVFDRVGDVNVKTEELKGESKGMDDIEALMSQMHDLSFMLESNLSIPKTKSDSDNMF